MVEFVGLSCIRSAERLPQIEEPTEVCVQVVQATQCVAVIHHKAQVGHRRNGAIDVEQEGDTEFTSEKVLLEDELMNLIRLDPENIPLGKIQLLPGLFFTRLKHDKLKPQEVVLTKETTGDETHYTVNFPERKLTIKAEAIFPHKILGWEEEFTERGQSYRTTAVLDKTLYTDYWRQNKNEFLPLRDSLGLSPINF